MKVKLQIVEFKTKKIRIKCDDHGIQKVVPIPNPTNREIGGIMCVKCAKERSEVK